MSNRGCHRFQIKLSTLSLTDRKGKSQNILIFVCSWLLFRALMSVLAQLVEHRFVVPGVASSILVDRPISVNQ